MKNHTTYRFFTTLTTTLIASVFLGMNTILATESSPVELNVGLYQTKKMTTAMTNKLDNLNIPYQIKMISSTEKSSLYKIVIGVYEGEALASMSNKLKKEGFKVFKKVVPLMSSKEMIASSSSDPKNLVYTKSFETKVLEKPNKTSKITSKLKRGSAVEKIGEKSPWVNIKMDSINGWVHQLALTTNKPKKRVSLLESQKDLSTSSRKRARTFTSAAAARGLAKSGDDTLDNRQLPDFEALSQLEKQGIDEDSAIVFMMKDETK